MSTLKRINHRYDWNSNGDGTYTFHQRKGGFEERPIPEHPQLDEIYSFAFNFARDNYCTTYGSFSNCMKEIEEKFGKVSDEVRDYIENCPFDAGDRAGMLIEDPHHYE